MAAARNAGNLELVEYMMENEEQEVDYSFFESFNAENYQIAKYLINKGADLDYVDIDERTESAISAAFNQKNFYSLVYLICAGASFDQKFCFSCLEKYTSSTNHEKNLLRNFVVDYQKDRIWNIHRNKFFPLFFKQFLFQFLLSLKVFSIPFGLKIPKVLQLLIFQIYTTIQIHSNHELRIELLKHRKNFEDEIY